MNNEEDNRDTTVVLVRVANGWIVEPRVGMLDTSKSDNRVYVFQTFEALVKWLDEHFTKPNKK